MNHNISQPLKSYTQQLNKPLDLISFNQVNKDQKYKHVKMSHEKLNNLEKNGFITTYEGTIPGAKYVSLSQLELLVKKEKQEAQTTITFNALNKSKEFRHLRWSKVTKLVSEGELEFVKTISGFKAVTISSLKKYIKKIESSNSNDGFISTSKILTTYKQAHKILYTNVTTSFLKYAMDNGVQYKKINDSILLDIKELENFLGAFNSKWIQRKEATQILKVSPTYLFKQSRKRKIKTLRLGRCIYYSRVFIESELTTLSLKRKQQKLIHLRKIEENKNIKELKNLGNKTSLSNALLFLKGKGVHINKEESLISLCLLLNIKILNAKTTNQKLIYWKHLKKISNEYVPFSFTEPKITNYCKENNIPLVPINNSTSTLISKDNFQSLLSHFYYCKSDAQDLLNASNPAFQKIKKQYINTKYIFTIRKSVSYFLKSAIDTLVLQQQEYFTEWMDWREAKKFINNPKMLQHYTSKNQKIKTIEAPLLIHPLIQPGRLLYSRRDVIHLAQELEKSIQFNNLGINNPYNVFELGVKQIYNLEFDSIASKAKKIWFDFVKKKLFESKKNEQGTRSYLKQLIACTNLIATVTSELKKEIFNFTSNELNTHFFGPDDIPKDYKKIFYSFITKLHSQFRELANSVGKKVFNLNNVLKVHNEIKSKKCKDIYPFIEYLQLYDYANNINLHKQQAINDTRLNLKGLPCSRYDSMWLLLLVNLNNPWNHGDILNLPKVDLTMTEIKSLEWLEHNEITSKDVKSILIQLKLWDSRREKTNIQQNFHISSELELAFATAISICELRRNAESSTSQNTLIDLKTTSQRLKRSHKPYIEFFKNLHSDFYYENLKLSRSIISYKYTVLSEYTEPNEETIKYERGHSKQDTTNIYVHIPSEHLDFLCKQLFARDFFGNIYYNLSNILYGETKKRDEQTLRIINLKKRLGDILRTERISAILNELSNEKKVVDEIIFGMDTPLVKSIHDKLSCHNLQAKEKDYQCLNYPNGCVYPGRSCIRCPLSVGNHLAVMSVINKLKNSLYEISNTFDSSTTQEKTVIANQLNQNLIDFGACISQFTQQDANELYQLLSIEREDFLSFLAKLPNYEYYITYNPKLER
ncbi:hypothetical protein [Bacillus sp. 1A]|uniref:hypothetical protein n=1 Tax=Bacillus sp. 1A TaxID=3461399 RepID=UPI00404422DC